MALKIDNRVRETTTTAGQGTLSLNGPPVGYQSFWAAIGNNNTTYYTIVDGAQWEVGIGTVGGTITAPTLARTTVLSSTAGGSKIALNGGSNDVFVDYPANKAVAYDENNRVVISTYGGLAPNIYNSTSQLTIYSSLDGSSVGNLVRFGTPANFNFGSVQTYIFNSINTLTITSAGQFVISTGSVSTPAGTPKFIINSTGQIGLGGTIPDTTYQIKSTGPIYTSSNSGYTVSGTTSATLTTDAFNTLLSASGGLVFRTSTSEKMRITSDGDVGIGTASPSGAFGGPTLAIYGSSQARLALKNSATGDSAGAGFQIGISTDTAPAGFLENRGTGPITFATNLSERMRILGTGEIGIGTTAPTAYLQIKAGTATANTAPLKFTSGTNLTTAEAGAVEYNGTTAFVTGTAASGRGINLAPQMVRVNTDRAKANNNTTLEAVFDAANDTLALAANTLYYFKGVYLVTKSLTTGNAQVSLGFGFSNAQQDIGYKFISYNAISSTTQTSGYIAQAIASVVTATATAATDYVVEIEGWFKSNATTGGTLIPQFAQSVAGDTAAPTMKANSWFMVQPMSGTTATLIAGNWT